MKEYVQRWMNSIKTLEIDTQKQKDKSPRIGVSKEELQTDTDGPNELHKGKQTLILNDMIVYHMTYHHCYAV